jgi:uncharacterized membrane protein YfcA
VRRRDGVLLGLFSVAGAAGGVAIANSVSGKALQVGFALFTLLVAVELVRKTLRKPTHGGGSVHREEHACPQTEYCLAPESGTDPNQNMGPSKDT